MRVRVAGSELVSTAGALALALALAAAPRPARAQQMAPAPQRVSVHAGSAGAAMSSRELVALESRLQHVALLQELYWTEHKTYAPDLAALGATDAGSASGAASVTITESSANGWAARALHPGLPGVGCMMSVVAPKRASSPAAAAAAGPQSLASAPGRRLKGTRLVDVDSLRTVQSRPVVVCDRE